MIGIITRVCFPEDLRLEGLLALNVFIQAPNPSRFYKGAQGPRGLNEGAKKHFLV